MKAGLEFCLAWLKGRTVSGTVGTSLTTHPIPHTHTHFIWIFLLSQGWCGTEKWKRYLPLDHSCRLSCLQIIPWYWQGLQWWSWEQRSPHSTGLVIGSATGGFCHFPWNSAVRGSVCRDIPPEVLPLGGAGWEGCRSWTFREPTPSSPLNLSWKCWLSSEATHPPLNLSSNISLSSPQDNSPLIPW